MVELTFIITNGYVDKETIEGYVGKGWNFVCTVPAKTIHTNALETDKATIFSSHKQFSPNMDRQTLILEESE